jgi:hypothetical protein
MALRKLLLSSGLKFWTEATDGFSNIRSERLKKQTEIFSINSDFCDSLNVSDIG